MGVTIHYKGRLKNIEEVNQLVDELEEVARTNEWHYQIIDTLQDFVEMIEQVVPEDLEELELSHLRGIALGQPESEPIWMVFDEDGQLITPMVAYIRHQDPEYYKTLDFHAFTRTQSGGPEYHIKLVKLLKYLSSKYFDEWEVLDDGQYYVSGDEEKLKEQMLMIDRSMAALNDAFEAHGENLLDKSEDEIKDFISNVLGSDALNVNVVKIGDELPDIDLDELLDDDEE